MINFQYQSQLNSSTLQKRDIVCYKDVELSTKKGKKKENFQSFRIIIIIILYHHIYVSSTLLPIISSQQCSTSIKAGLVGINQHVSPCFAFALYPDWNLT